jgi:hypothetical protein
MVSREWSGTLTVQDRTSIQSAGLRAAPQQQKSFCTCHADAPCLRQGHCGGSVGLVVRLTSPPRRLRTAGRCRAHGESPPGRSAVPFRARFSEAVVPSADSDYPEGLAGIRPGGFCSRHTRRSAEIIYLCLTAAAPEVHTPPCHVIHGTHVGEGDGGASTRALLSAF